MGNKIYAIVDEDNCVVTLINGPKNKTGMVHIEAYTEFYFGGFFNFLDVDFQEIEIEQIFSMEVIEDGLYSEKDVLKKIQESDYY